MTLTKHGTAHCQICGLEVALKSRIKGSIAMVLVDHFGEDGTICDASNTNHWY